VLNLRKWAQVRSRLNNHPRSLHSAWQVQATRLRLSSQHVPSLSAQLDSQPGYTAPVTGPGQVELLSAPGADDVFGQQQQRRPLVRARRHASAGSAQAFGQLMDESHTGASYGAACRAL